MSAGFVSIYRVHYDSAEWFMNGGNFKVLQVPMDLTLTEQCDGKTAELDGENDHFLVLVDVNGIGVYHTDISPIADESQFSTQVVYFDWEDVNQYVVDEWGDEWWCGYDFHNDSYWSGPLTAVANLYYAMTHSIGTSIS